MTIARDFTSRLADLLSRERFALADFLVLLAEFDQRRLWLELSHSHPNASDEDILAAGLDLLLAHDAKRKGLVERPQQKIRASNPQRIPAHVRREVWKRDGGRCQWRLESGGICGSTRCLQFDHITPPALGGTSTVENVRLLCGCHNVLAARRVYGDACMDRYTRVASRAVVAPRPGAITPGCADPPR